MQLQHVVSSCSMRLVVEEASWGCRGIELTSEWFQSTRMGAELASTTITSSANSQIKPSNVDAGWGPKYFWFYRDIWRSSDVPTNSFPSIEIHTICYLAICDCLQLDSKPKIFLKLRKKHDICYINVKQNACFLRLSPE